MADKSAARRQTEGASLSTADLGGDTQCVMSLFGQQNAFDVIAVPQSEKKLAGTVSGGLNPFDVKPSDGEMAVQQAADFLGKISHFIKTVGLTQIYPAENLGSTERSHAVCFKPLGQLGF